MEPCARRLQPGYLQEYTRLGRTGMRAHMSRAIDVGGAATVIKLAIAMTALMLVASQAAIAQGAFDVNVSFELTDTKVGANPGIKIHIDQPAGQPEMGHVTLRIPKGFKIPGDAAFADGDQV